MLMEITERNLMQNSYAVVDDILIDFKNKLIYKVYKLNTGEEANYMKNVFDICEGGQFIFKTQNYMAKIFNENYSSFIFKQYENEDFLSKTQEELSRRSKVIYKDFEELEELYKDFANEIKQRLISLTSKRVVYFLLPLKIAVNEKTVNQVWNKHIKDKDNYFKKYDKFAQKIEKMKFNDYNYKMADFKKEEEEIDRNLLIKIINPTIDIETAEAVKEANSEITSKNVKTITDFETDVKPMILKGSGEVNGVFDSFFYDEVFLGDKYYNILNFYNDQIASLKSGEKYFKIIQKIIKNFNYMQIYNNRILITSSVNNMFYFLASAKSIINQNENLFQQIDEISDNFDFVLKFEKVDKNQIISYIDENINANKLKTTTIVNKERESREVLESTRLTIRKQQDYYISLKNKILDENENVYSISGYFFKKLILKNQETTIQDLIKMKGIDIRQTVPDKKDLRLVLDLKNDLYGFFIHTRPALHYLNGFKNLKNIDIINDNDKERMEAIQLNSI